MIQKMLVLSAVIIVIVAQSATPIQTQSRSSTSVVLYEGARLIRGDGSQPVLNSAMLVENGMITTIGVKGGVNAPRAALRIDLTGKTIMPTLVNAHGHPGF